MKHAILILAHNHPSYVTRLISSFDEDFYIFIHWDKKTWNKAYLPILTAHPNVKEVCSQYNVYWGGYSIVKSTLLLCKKAVIYEDIEYLHLISGADLLTKDISYFKNFFQTHNSDNFIECFKLPTPIWEGGGLNRLLYYHITDKVDLRTIEGFKSYKEDLHRQQQTGSERKLPNFQIYGGSNWWSLTKECISYVLKESRKRKWKTLFTDTFVPDEMYFQTILMNSSYVSKIKSNNFRYICWETRHGNTPAILDQTDIIPILLSNHLFARKINIFQSKLLISGINAINHFNVKQLLIESTKEVQLKYIAQMLYETVDSWPLKGLMCGKMGICLFLYHYGVLTESQLFWNKSYEVLCNILRDSKVNRELDYNHGALGIASAIEYLRNHQFIELNTDKLLTKIDSFVITSIQKMIDNGFKKTSMSLYHFDIYISQRKKNKPEFEKLPLFEKEMRQFTTTQYFNNRNKVSEWFKHPQNIKSPGIIGWAGYGWKLINQIYPDYPIDNSLFYEYISF